MKIKYHSTIINFSAKTESHIIKISFLILLLISGYTGFSQTGPGGIGTDDGLSTLDYWIDANRGVTINGSNEISEILDLSGNSRANTVNMTPTIETNTLNTLSVIRFNGTSESIQTDWNIEESAYPDLTAIAVYIPAVEYSQTVWGAYTSGFQGRYLTDNNIASPTTNNFVGPGYQPSLPHGSSQISGLFPTGTPVITSVVMVEDATNGTDVRVNGNIAASFTADHSGDGLNNLAIANASGSNFWYNGDIAEVVFYGEDLTDLQLIIIENYLSAKYGITLTANDIYTRDNNGYDFDVAGIGRINASDIQDDSQGTGIVTIRNPSDLGNSEYFFFGHNAASLAFNESSDVPASVSSRLSRVWSSSEVGDVGTLDIRWDLTDLGTYSSNQLAILIDTDVDGQFDDETPISGASNLGSNIFEFASVEAFSNNRNFTLALLSTPLPIELIRFEVEQVDNDVHISWATAIETNNDFFTLERSSTAKNWEVIGELDGAGNSETILNYEFIDKSHLSGTSYYRLKQTDFDGRYEYSSIASVNYLENRVAEIQVFPNPSQTHIQFAGLDTPEGIYVVNLAGKNMTSLVKVSKNGKIIRLDWSNNMPSGTYFIKINQASFSITRKVIIADSK